MLLFLRTHIRPVWGPKTAAHLGILGANPFHIYVSAGLSRQRCQFFMQAQLPPRRGFIYITNYYINQKSKHSQAIQIPKH